MEVNALVVITNFLLDFYLKIVRNSEQSICLFTDFIFDYCQVTLKSIHYL